MKKTIVILIVLALFITTFTGCGERIEIDAFKEVSDATSQEITDTAAKEQQQTAPTTKEQQTTENLPTEVEDEFVEVPVVIGYTYEQAKEILNKAGLEIKEAYDFSSTYEEGIVFTQSIAVGTRVTPNSTVIVTISKGAVTFVLPDVIGNNQETAEATLKAKDLKVSFQYEETDNSILWGTVKSSDPVSGTSVKNGDVITLVIYIGLEVAHETIPVVEGKGFTTTEVRSELDKLGFYNVTVIYEYDEKIEKGIVISITGATEGEKASVTTPITVVVSKGQKD